MFKRYRSNIDNHKTVDSCSQKHKHQAQLACIILIFYKETCTVCFHSSKCSYILSRHSIVENIINYIYILERQFSLICYCIFAKKGDKERLQIGIAYVYIYKGLHSLLSYNYITTEQKEEEKTSLYSNITVTSFTKTDIIYIELIE